MRFASVSLLMLTCLCISFAVGCRSPKGASVKEKRSYVLQMKRETLAELYKEHPDAKAHVARAPGHAVFSLVGSKILMLATGNGFGVATDAKTGRNTFMRMVEVGGGVGIGYKVYKAVYVFNDKEAFQTFLDGRWQAAGDADAEAKYQGQGGGASAALTTDELTSPVTVYQFTNAGVTLSAVATGTRYYEDEELN